MDPEAQAKLGETPFQQALRWETRGLIRITLAISVVSSIGYFSISYSSIAYSSISYFSIANFSVGYCHQHHRSTP